MFKVCSYYTEGTPYEEEVKVLCKSARKIGLDIHVEGRPNRFSWKRNVQQRVPFLLDCMEKFDCDIVWVDADAEFKQYPKLFDTIEEDFAAHYKRGRELLGGTLFLRNNDRVRSLLREWQTEQETDKYNLQQVALSVCLSHRPDVTVYKLPAPYTLIFDTMRKEGPAVIQHNQASRRLKRVVRQEKTDIPNVIGSTRIRKWPDGSFGILRRDKALEKRFDTEHVRVHNTLRWFPREHDGVMVSTVRHSFNGQTCVIVGKGPSLDHLKKEDFTPDDVVICLNESIHKVATLGLDNTVFALQQDTKLKDLCHHPNHITFVSRQSRKFYARYDNKILYYPEEYKATPSSASAVCAIRIAKSLGATGFKMYCFDACVNGDLAYADCIADCSEYPTPGRDPERFKKHRRVFEHEADLEWYIPTQEPDKQPPLDGI